MAWISERLLRQNWPTIAEITPNTGKRGKRLVSELGWRYDPRFDFSGLSYAQSFLLLRLRALFILKSFMLNDLGNVCSVLAAGIQVHFQALFP